MTSGFAEYRNYFCAFLGIALVDGVFPLGRWDDCWWAMRANPQAESLAFPHETQFTAFVVFAGSGLGEECLVCGQ